MLYVALLCLSFGGRDQVYPTVSFHRFRCSLQQTTAVMCRTQRSGMGHLMMTNLCLVGPY